MNNNLEKELAFALSAGGRGAINFEEFHQWVELAIAENKELPTYFFDLYDVKALWEAESVVREGARFYPSSTLNSRESEALWGIAMKRGRAPKDFQGLITKKTAFKRLEEYPHVVERFKKTFPFIQLDI